jgi:hypothetical protein
MSDVHKEEAATANTTEWPVTVLGIHGESVQVKQSSLASEAALWLTVKSEGEVFTLLGVEAVRQVRDALSEWLEAAKEETP